MATPSTAIIGAPYQQVFSTGDQYRYNGEMSPEQALQEQALNRKQQIANLLIQRGLQQPQGQMVGRFYVPPNPAQNVAQLGSILAGVYGGSQINQERKDLASQSNQAMVDALAQYRTQTGPQTQTLEQEGPGAPVAKSLMEVDPYIQQVNATAQPSKMWDQQTVIDQGKNGAGTIDVPAEMNAALEIQRERQQRGPGFYSEGPRPTTQLSTPASSDQKQQALVDLLANADPRVRSIGNVLMAQRERQDQRADDQAYRDKTRAEDMAFKTEQAGLDREVKREGIDSAEGMKLAMLQNTLAMKESQQAADDRAGIRNENLRRDIEKDRAEAKKLEAQMNDRRERDIAKMNLEGKKEIAGMIQENKNNRQQLTPTVQKEIFETDEAINSSNNVIASLNRALSINEKAYEGGLASMRQQAMGFVPGKYEGEDATVELKNITQGQALDQLKATFGSMPTEGERKILLEIQGSVDMKAQQRKEIFDRAKTMVERRLKFNQEKAQKLRDGTYFNGPPMTMPSQDLGPSPNAASAQGGWSIRPVN